MGYKNYKRRGFLQQLINGDAKSDDVAVKDADQTDKLFEKYSRKELGERHYSDEPASPLARVAPLTTGLAPYTGTWTDWEVMHLLRRTGFGVKKADVASLEAMTTSSAVAYLLNITTPAIPSSTTPLTTLPAGTLPSTTPLNHYNAIYADSNGVAAGADWTNSNLIYGSLAANVNDGSIDSYRNQSLVAWHWGLWLNSDMTIREKMVNFWYHLIPVNFDDIRNLVGNQATISYLYMNLLRAYALGNFRVLIEQICKQPAMLVYLGNQYSTAAAPNENLGRELMELFTMGKVPTQNYTEADVQAAAKVLTGWRVASFTATAATINVPFVSAFNATYHNTTQSGKIFSNFTAPSSITSPNPPTVTITNNGASEIDDFFNMLFSTTGNSLGGLTIAKYICRRLYRFFVYYDIDTATEANVITPLANTFIASNWEIKPVMQQLLASQHFFDIANRGVMIKSPFDFIAGAFKTLNINSTPTTNTAANQYAIWLNLHSNSYSNMEQGFGYVPNVSGWKAYYQEPAYYQNWINSNTVQKRYSYVNSLLSGYTVGGLSLKIDPVAWVAQFPQSTVDNPDSLVDLVVRYFLPVDLDSTYKSTVLKVNLLNGNTTNSYWTTAYDSYITALGVTPVTTASTSTLNATLATVKSRLTALFTAVLQLAEFQLM